MNKQRLRFVVFTLIALALLAQVAWWTTLFVKNVNEIEVLQGYTATEAFHKRVMFISESGFFLMLMGVGLFLLYRALRFDEKAHESQKNFIEILAHESKTPLTALKLRLESLLEMQKDAYTKSELTAGIDEIRRLTSIVEKTLNLNRMEREELVKELVCVSDVVRDLVRRLEPFFKAKGVAVTLNLTSEACVLGDVDGLRNSFQSVIENSILYNDKAAKTLEVSLSERSGSISVRFSDNGPGISLQDKEMIFEKFYRGKSRSKTAGTGLGLYIARSILNAHHGLIRVLPSQTGAVFEIGLPVAT